MDILIHITHAEYSEENGLYTNLNIYGIFSLTNPINKIHFLCEMMDFDIKHSHLPWPPTNAQNDSIF